MKITSPMATGNGAYVIHKLLESKIPGYRVCSYSPYLELIPPAMRFIKHPLNAEIIHTTPDYAIFYHSKKIPLILTFHNYVLDSSFRPYNSLIQKIHYATDLRLWTFLAAKKSQSITAVSAFTAKLVKKDLRIDRPIRVIYNGIDTTRFVPENSKITRKKVNVIFSGNLTRRKGSQWLPEIARRLQKNINIYYTLGLRARKSIKNSENIKSIGTIPYDQMPCRYHQMDILLHPSVREGLCLSILEAMGCALPVVASDCSSIPEQIDHGKGGFLCPVGDVDAFAERINQLADSPELRKEMGEYNRAKVEKYFTLERMVSEYRELFEQVLESSHRI
jgi:glycosyltransferase involved in cell wall biosynthesis